MGFAAMDVDARAAVVVVLGDEGACKRRNLISE